MKFAPYFMRIMAEQFSAIGLRAMSAIVQLGTLYLISANYSSAVYQDWILLSNILVLQFISDWGFSNAFMQDLLQPESNTTPRKGIIFSNYIFIATAVILLNIIVVIFIYVNDIYSFKVSPNALQSVWIFLLSPLLAILPQLAQKGCMAEQKLYLYNGLQLTAQLLSFLLLAITCIFKMPFVMVACFAITPPLIIFALFFARLAIISKVSGLLSFQYISSSFLLSATQKAMPYLYLMILYIAATQIDIFIVAHFSSPEWTATYGTLVRITGYVTTLQGLLAAPLWAAIAHTKNQGNLSRSISILRHGIYLSSLCSGILAIFFFMFKSEIQLYWLNDKVALDTLLAIGMFAWVTLEGIGNMLYQFILATGKLHMQIACATLFSVISIGLKISAAASGHYHLIPVAAIIAYIPTTMIPYFKIIMGTQKI